MKTLMLQNEILKYNSFGDIHMCLFVDRSTLPLLFDRLTCRLRMLPEGWYLSMASGRASMSKKYPSARQQVERQVATTHRHKNKANPPPFLFQKWQKVLFNIE